MRVGIVLHLADPTIGGGHTFQDSVLEGLALTQTSHQIVLLLTAAVPRQVRERPDWTVVQVGGRSALPRAASTIPQVVRRSLIRAGVRPIRASFRRAVHAVSPATSSALEKTVQDLDLDAAWFCGVESEVLSVPFFATVWDLEHRKQPYFPEVSRTGWDWNAREQRYSRVLPRAARIFTGTQESKEEIVHYYRVNPANVVVNPLAAPGISRDAGGDPAKVLARHGLEPGFLLYPAQFWPHKNHVGLLLALKLLATEYGLVPQLVLTGSDKGNLGHVHSVSTDLGLESRVKVLGFVQDADLEALYREASLLVFPTFFGPDNVPPLEAFALGCPVAASDIAGARQQLEDAALYFDPAKPGDMAATIAAALGSAELRERLIERGRAIVASRSPQRYVEAVLQVVDDFEPLRRNWRNDYVHT